ERHRQVLRRRHLAQAQAAGEAEGRQEAHEAGRFGRDPAGGLPGRAAGGQGQERISGQSMIFDFSFILVAATLLTGLIWAIDALAFKPKRMAAAAARGVAPENVREPVL